MGEQKFEHEWKKFEHAALQFHLQRSYSNSLGPTRKILAGRMDLKIFTVKPHTTGQNKIMHQGFQSVT